eukprot:6603865-Prymnesium_polylepis.1
MPCMALDGRRCALAHSVQGGGPAWPTDQAASRRRPRPAARRPVCAARTQRTVVHCALSRLPDIPRLVVGCDIRPGTPAADAAARAACCPASVCWVGLSP